MQGISKLVFYSTFVNTKLLCNFKLLTIPHAGIDYAFKTLASTGLKIRILGLDVIANTARTATYASQALFKA
jgi:hypothetical protein